jgi:hypothetical protein
MPVFEASPVPARLVVKRAEPGFLPGLVLDFQPVQTNNTSMDGCNQLGAPEVADFLC